MKKSKVLLMVLAILFLTPLVFATQAYQMDNTNIKPQIENTFNPIVKPYAFRKQIICIIS